MASKDPAERREIARQAANKRWAKATPAERTENGQRGQQGLRAKLAEGLDEKAAENAYRAHLGDVRRAARKAANRKAK